MQLPSGTVTFAFTDVAGSTERWDRDRAAMQDALRRHDAIVRRAIEAHGGYVFKTIGDAFCACFGTARAALAAMLDVQRALAAEDFAAVDGIRVRAALHAGTADERDGDYFGPAVNRVARLLSIAHGGQVLVSGTAADLLEGELPPQTGLHDLGERRLKDLSRPERVFQLVAPDLPTAFPPLRSLDEMPNNLPRRLTSFVGREAVLAEVAELTRNAALVSLVGPGGAGKTRLAVQVAAELLEQSADGVWLVELARISDPSLVANAVAHVLGVEDVPTRTPLEGLVAFLRRKQLLLILDNCEHVIDHARDVACEIVRNCPDVRILVTSREALNVTGEEVFRIPSLPVPPREAVRADEVARYGAVTLFVDRARSVEKRFALTDHNAADVAEIVRRLDGIPLAIELAAVRVKMLSPQQLRRRLSERFDVLTGGDRSALPRQQTMRALIDWSYDLLSEEERVLFRRLSIFVGGFTLEAATRVCGDGDADAGAVLDHLGSLVDKSLVHADMGAGGTRYRLLEATHQYAREKLAGSGEYDAIAHEHARAFYDLALVVRNTWETTPSPEWVAVVAPEFENWRAAMEWALERRGDLELGQRLAAYTMITCVSSLAEMRRWAYAGVATIDDSTPNHLAAELEGAQAFADWRLALHKSSCLAAQRLLARVQGSGDTFEVAWAKRLVGNALVMLGRLDDGVPLLEEALASARRSGLRKFTGWVLESLGTARYLAGDIDGARALLGEGLAIARDTAHWQLAATVSLALAKAEFRAGDAEAALRVAGGAEAAYRAWNDAPNVASARSDAAAYLIALDRYDEASAHVRAAIGPLRDAQRDVALTVALQHVAAIAALRRGDGATDEAKRAASLLGYVDRRVRELDAVRELAEERERERAVAALEAALGASALERLMREGSTWGEDQAVSCALEADSVLAA